jgi:hypothetical protein
MKRIPWPVALLLLLGALGFAYSRIVPALGPTSATRASGPPKAPRGTGPTPEQLRRWAAGLDAAEKRRQADVEKYSKKKAPNPAPAQPAPKGGE